MAIDVDPKVAVALLNYIPKAMAVAKKVFATVDEKLDYSIRSAHLEYATAVVRKYSKAKTFLIRTEAVDLYEFYVPASVELQDKGRVERVDLQKLRSIAPRLVISGSGGSGKTILLPAPATRCASEWRGLPDPCRTAELE